MSDFLENVPADAVSEEIASMFDLSQKKKKKKKKVEVTNQEENGTPSIVPNDSITKLDPPTYIYTQLLDRAVFLLHEHNPEYTEKRKHTMKPPQLMRGKRVILLLLY